MDLREVKQIVEMMKRADLTEFEIEEEGLKLRIARERQLAAAAPMPQPAPIPQQAAPAAPAAAAEAAPAKEEGPVISSPMVGTFYGSPNPESPSFVKVGDRVQKDTVVCIIEAMKVMNEIQAEQSGVITEVLVENAQSVEYGQPLFRIKPA